MHPATENQIRCVYYCQWYRVRTKCFLGSSFLKKSASWREILDFLKQYSFLFVFLMFSSRAQNKTNKQNKNKGVCNMNCNHPSFHSLSFGYLPQPAHIKFMWQIVKAIHRKCWKWKMIIDKGMTSALYYKICVSATCTTYMLPIIFYCVHFHRLLRIDKML